MNKIQLKLQHERKTTRGNQRRSVASVERRRWRAERRRGMRWAAEGVGGSVVGGGGGEVEINGGNSTACPSLGTHKRCDTREETVLARVVR